jgi:uncharacterized membrane protein
MTETTVNARAVMRWLMAAFYVIAGIGHLAAPDAFLPIVPDWVPMPRGVILLTGLCELAGAAALDDGALAPARRHHAGTLCAVRLARQHQARAGPHFATARSGQLVVSRTGSRFSRY